MSAQPQTFLVAVSCAVGKDHIADGYARTAKHAGERIEHISAYAFRA